MRTELINKILRHENNIKYVWGNLLQYYRSELIKLNNNDLCIILDKLNNEKRG